MQKFEAFKQNSQKSKIYFDSNSTKLPNAKIINTLLDEAIFALPLNPSSIHSIGKEAKMILDKSIRLIKTSLNAKCHDIIFTSSGTEANNMALSSFGSEVNLVLSTDHECSINYPNVIKVRVSNDGNLDINHLIELLNKHKDKQITISICLANNQTGVIQDHETISKTVREYTNYKALIHYDLAQYISKEYFSFSEIDCDIITFTGHKIGALQGGVVIYNSSLDPKPIFYGGSQQNYKRPGTENLPSIYSLALAVSTFNTHEHISKYKSHTLKLKETIEKHTSSLRSIVICQNSNRITNTSLISTPPIESLAQLIEYDLNNIMVSIGSACSSGKVLKSHVLKELGVSNEVANSVIRISLEESNTIEEVECFLSVYRSLINRCF